MEMNLYGSEVKKKKNSKKEKQSRLLSALSPNVFLSDILANDRVSFEVEKGTVHALLGENGAARQRS